MGRLFVQFFSSPARVCICSECGIQLTNIDNVRWSGVMGDHEPAKNYAGEGVINVDLGSPYSKQLSSGRYELREVSCVRCHTYLGWKYEVAEANNKDREGTYMLLDKSFTGPFSD